MEECIFNLSKQCSCEKPCFNRKGNKKQKVIYISGAVSSDKNFREKFDRAEKFLQSKGFTVVNPVKGEPDGKEWTYYMKKDIVKLMNCDCVYALSDCSKSKGARIELWLASDLGMEIIAEGELK